MALFPPNIRPEYGYERGGAWDALVVKGSSGYRQVREHNAAAIFRAKMTFSLSTANLAEIEAFVAALRGPAVTFEFYDLDPWRANTGLAVGTGDGTTQHFLIGLTDIDRQYAPSLTVAAAAKVEGTDYEVGVENRIVYAEDFTQTATWAVVGGSTVTRTAGQAAPTGPATAYRIETSGGSGTAKMQQASLGTPTLGQRSRLSVWIKNLSATKAVTVADGIGGTQTVAAAADWTEVVLTSAGDGSTAITLSFSAPDAGDALDFRVWHPWLAWYSSMWGNPVDEWGFIPTGSAARTADTTNRKLNVSFYTASIPASGAILLTAAGRLYYSKVALTGEPSVVAVRAYRRYGYQLEIEQVT